MHLDLEVVQIRVQKNLHCMLCRKRSVVFQRVRTNCGQNFSAGSVRARDCRKTPIEGTRLTGGCRTARNFHMETAMSLEVYGI